MRLESLLHPTVAAAVLGVAFLAPAVEPKSAEPPKYLNYDSVTLGFTPANERFVRQLIGRSGAGLTPCSFNSIRPTQAAKVTRSSYSGSFRP